MKPLIVLSALGLCFLLPAGLRSEDAAKSAPTPPAPDETTLLADLRGSLPGLFYYGTWQDHVISTKGGLRVLGDKGAQGKGGLGRSIDPAVDFRQVAYVEVALGLVPGNEVPEFTIALNDADGTQYTARIRVGQIVPGQPVWLRVHRDDFRFSGVEPGKDSVMDWAAVARWHLQGDWNTDKPCQVVFIALRTRK